MVLVGLLAAAGARAQTFSLGPPQDLIGSPSQIAAEQKDTLPDIARENHLGFDEIVAANPGVDTWLPGAGRIVRLPTQHLLPNVPRTGIVVNLPKIACITFGPMSTSGPWSRAFPSASARWIGKHRSA